MYICKLCKKKEKYRQRIREHILREHIKRDPELRQKYKEGKIRIMDFAERE